MSKAASALAKKTPLPSKEATLFKELLTLYETRQLKKGLKTADLILKKFPEHGETLCMKGLVMTHMGRKDEGIDLVKKGVRLDLMSHICWHVFGLIQKADKHYEEALKSYTQALRFDKDNMNLLRDSAQLQTQLRLFDNLVDTRHTILKLRPNQRQNWVALALAHHLNGNLLEAKMIMDHYLRSLKNIPDYDTEHSETLIYYIRLLEEIGELSEALSILDVSSKSRAIVDRTSILEIRARILSKQKSTEAEEAWRALIEHNSDNYDYYRGYLKNLGITEENGSSEALTKLQELVDQLPRAAAPRRLQLTIASGDEFRNLIKPYITKGLTRGIPSLFADLKALYADQEKQRIIEDVVEACREEYAHLSSVEPTTLLWTLYFLAQHYSYLSQFAKALSALEQALTHTPTLPELHMCKARLLKRSGDYFGAARCLNDARLLDGQDRFLNTKCGKYLLRCGMIEEASSIFGLFTKKDAISPAADLEDMQSLLFLLEEADAYRRNGKPNLALKKYMAVKKIYDEIEDDQFDFHGYNLRKFTLNIYLKLLAWENELRSHPGYVKAAIQASKIFVSVYDDPSIVTALSSSSHMTDAEKKAKKKAKKAAQKVQDDKKVTPATSTDKDLEDVKPKDDDPDGLKQLGASDPLEQASKLLHPLTTLVPNNVDVWIAIYDVAIRRKKLLQAVGALNHAVALDPSHPELHIRLVDLRIAASSLPQQPPAPIGPVFADALAKIIPGELSNETFNSQYLQRHSSNPQATLAAAKVSHKLKAPRDEVEAGVFALVGPEVKLDIATALSATEFLAVLQSSRVDEFRAACQARFELSTVFKGPPELVLLRQQVLSGTSAGVEDETVA
ncbi:NMDA receptor-regulated protein 1-domain-containing protein [Crassisporium funariophilum]|nr:NMDA receptor-regulated protein 1-domain-containing protein [Crassisporium funariophilum]